MIFRALISKNSSKYFALAFLLLIGAFLRFSKLKQLFTFDYDQMIAAEAAYDFFTNHKLSLIGQELSFQGFFLGPLHNWIQFIPYGLCNLLPDCVGYFYSALGLAAAVILYFLSKNIFDSKTAHIASTIYLISFVSVSQEMGVNSNYFLFLSSIGLLFSLKRYFAFKNNFLLIGAFIAGIATVNFNPVYVFSTLAFFFASLIRKQRSFLLYLAAICAFLINYIPLIIFNFRHDNLLLDSFRNFANQSVGNVNYIEKLIFLIKDVLIPFYSNFLFQNTNPFFIILTILLLTAGTGIIVKSNFKFLLFFPFSMLITTFGLVFYKGHIPDYYFLQTLFPFTITTAVSARKNLLLLLIFAPIFLYANISRVLNYNSSVNYQSKKDTVTYIIDNSEGQTFNVYYDLPLGLNTGYGYLFKAQGKNPQEGAQNLYILESINPERFELEKYRRTFPGKSIQVKVIGFVHIITIK